MNSKQIQLNRIASYLRLSHDDERNGESVSIENQREIINKYAEGKGLQITREYSDDGYSGTTFDRPGVQRLLADIKAGIIDTVIVKDLSRFGRNYILTGQYIDYIFPMYGVRFIAIQDNIDTADRESTAMDMMPIMNVFNEWHAANTSKKNKAVFEANARAGKYLAWRAPYGYVVGNDENRLPVIDEPAASNVRRIFYLRSIGYSPNKIARTFNMEHIPVPTDYRREKFGVKGREYGKHLWSGEPIREILSNPLYTGDLVQRRETTVSYKNKKHVFRPEEEWITVQGTHEAIINRELWEKVKAVNKSVSQGKPTGEGVILPLSGLMYCADCGSKMRYKRSRKALKNRNGDKPFYVCERYVCGGYSRMGECCCTSHVIHRKTIEAVIVGDIRSQARLVLDDEETARKIFLQRKEQLSDRRIKSERKSLEGKNKRLAELDGLIQCVYEDKAFGKVEEDICLNLLGKYQTERAALQTEIKGLQEQVAKADKNECEVDEFIRRIKKYINITELTREICLNLIEYITVDKFVKDKPRNIHIYYKLLDKNMKT